MPVVVSHGNCSPKLTSCSYCLCAFEYFPHERRVYTVGGWDVVSKHYHVNCPECNAEVKVEKYP